MIEIHNLNKKYGKKKVLDNINLRFEQGNVFGIVGENGAGKTTLFRCIAGLEDYDGEVKSPFKILRNHLGFLDTNPIIMSHITGWEYLKLLCIARNIEEEDFEAQNIFHLPLDQYADTYSTGMKKKLALMGVLLRQNEVIILDEPFNGVDIQSNMIITSLIKELKSLGKTVFISSHIFATLAETCDEITLLSKGKVIRSVTREFYSDLEKEMKSNLDKTNTKRIRIS